MILSEEELLALTRRKSSTPHYSLPSPLPEEDKEVISRVPLAGEYSD